MIGRGRLQAERGDGLVEFALCAAVFFVTVFGILEFGLAIWQYNVVATLAKEGARWAAVRGSTSGGNAVSTNGPVQTYVQGRALGLAPTVDATWPDGIGDGKPANYPGKKVQVVVTKNFTPPSRLIPHPNLVLRSTAQLIIAR
jgi:Flp pilus assembly protein TadG